MTKIAVIRISGQVHISHAIKKTLELLRLKIKNNCIILEDNPVNRGMIEKVRSYTTFGEVKEDTIKKIEKRKKPSGVYALHPPRKGYGRKGTKMPFTQGGALGDRKEKISELIERML